MQNIFDTLLGG